MFHDYFSCLSNKISKKNVIGYRKVKKVALDSFSDKRFNLDCGIHTGPYYEIKNNVAMQKNVNYNQIINSMLHVMIFAL